MKKILFATAALAMVGCGGSSHQAASQRAACQGVDTQGAVARIYSEASSGSAAPLYKTGVRTRAISTRYVSGSELTVPAPEGMSGEYIQRVLTCHSATGAQAHPNDVLAGNLEPASVQVRSAGASYRIAIEGRNRDDGKRIWSKAQALTQGGGGSVEVEQVSANAAAGNNL